LCIDHGHCLDALLYEITIILNEDFHGNILVYQLQWHCVVFVQDVTSTFIFKYCLGLSETSNLTYIEWILSALEIDYHRDCISLGILELISEILNN